MTSTLLPDAPTGRRRRRAAAAPEAEVVPSELNRLAADIAEPVRLQMSSTRRVHTPPGRGGILGWYSRRVAVVAVAVTAAVMSIGVATTGAYFTDAHTADGTTTTGTVTVDLLSAAGAAAPTFTVSNIVPLSAADSAVATKGTFVTFKVKGASLETRVRATLKAEATNTTAGLLPYVQVQIWNGTQWSAVSTPSATDASLSEEFTVAPNATSGDLKVRFFLKPETPNSLQGATLKFTLGAKSIQAVAPATAQY